MNHIQRYKLTRNKLRIIIKIIESREYMGAGLSIGVTEGKLRHDCTYDVDLEIADTDFIEGILGNIKDGLTASLKAQEFGLRDYRKSIVSFIDEIEREQKS